MARMREYLVTVIHGGRVYEMSASATSPAAALKAALRERRALREAVRDGKAGWEVATARTRS